MIDCKIGYGRTARLDQGDMILGPLPNEAHLRDLATEITPPDKRLDHAIARSSNIPSDRST